MRRLPVLCLLGFLSGCASAPKRTAKMTEIDVEQTTAEMRIRLRDYLRLFNTEIVAAADGVVAAEKDLGVQQAALQLKASAVTAMQAAVFQQDPIAALADAWALTAAMARFFEDGSGKNLFGGSQFLVIQALNRLEAQADEFAQMVVGKEHADRVRPEIDRFVRDNPIRDLSLGLRSAGLEASVVTAAGSNANARRSIVELGETARDISDRLEIYAEMLPRVAGWQAGILLIQARREVLAQPLAILDGVDRNLGAMGEDFDAVATFVTGTPALIAAERTQLQQGLDRERAAILLSVDAQRVATLEALTAEREAILAAVEVLRKASFTDLGTETERSLDRIDRLSAATMQELRRASSDAIDHMFWRFVELLVVAFGGVAVLAFALRRTRSESRS
jgi:hypothetical protein